MTTYVQSLSVIVNVFFALSIKYYDGVVLIAELYCI